uniref:Leucine zipper protein 1 n=1 Tax=Cynoglossus semilaevis TaxID=244447 RepID=A0A3P8WXX2_CYNSE
DIEALRKRLLKIQGKDEEVRKAEDLCRTVREKLEEEENLTKELKAEIERLQKRMAELEKLEEAFGKSKSDCSQLCLSLNEEKNLTKKLSTELETLKAKLKEMEGSETKLDRAEKALTMELDKLKTFTQTFMSERKRLLEKQREDEKIILKLTEKLEQQKNRLGMSVDPSRADFMRSRIEDELSSTGLLSNKMAGHKKNLDYFKFPDDGISLVNKTENEKNSILEGTQLEDNKVKELTLEVEKLKNRLKQLEIMEEDLKTSEFKNGELNEKVQREQTRARQLSEQVEQLRMQLVGKVVVGGNGSSNVDKHSNGSSSPKHRNRELSPQHKRETKLRSKELSHCEEGSPKIGRRALSPVTKRRTPKIPADNGIRDTGRGAEDRMRGTSLSSVNAPSSDAKKMSVLSRYPPAANDQKPLRMTHKQTDGEAKKNRVETFSKLYVGSDSESNNSDVTPDVCSSMNSISVQDKETDQESSDQVPESVSVASFLPKANGAYSSYRSPITPLQANDQGSEGHSSASETESTGSRPSEPEPVPETTPPTISKGSSSRSSFDEDLHSRTPLADGAPTHTASGIEIQRMCSPREALRSRAVIKPAIVEIDRKEMMISEPLSTNGKPKISTKPVVTMSKMTSSITIYPNDPCSSRTSSRSSSVCSEPMPARERHTSTSNILIGEWLQITSHSLQLTPNQRGTFCIRSNVTIQIHIRHSGFDLILLRL